MHRTLERQIKKYLADQSTRPEGWDSFLQAISDTYIHSDEDRALIERSLEISSQELTDKYQNLRASLEGAEELEKKLQSEKLNVEEKITERTMQFNNETARLQASINSLPIGLIMTDMSNQVVTMNPAAKKILYTDIKTPIDNMSIAQIEAFFSGGLDLTSKVTFCTERKESCDINEQSYNGKILHISLTPIITTNSDKGIENDVIGVIIVMQDITEQKTIDRSKDEFFSIASHELRTPLTAIRGNTSLIQQYFMDKIQDADLKEMINDIHESSIRLLSIVDDFLNTSRLEMGKIQFKKESIDMVELVKYIIKEYMATGLMKSITLQLQEPLEKISPVIADTDRVKQVLINLIGNALKFTEAGGITVSIEETQGMFVEVRVTDTGKGIPLENQQLLFHKFQQAGSSLLTRDDVHGTGLGLYISKMMLEGMQGKIWLESSQIGIGTTFAFRLPIKG